MIEPRRIAVVGGECTGKTTLCQSLAGELAGLWVPEVVREFVEVRGRAPTAAEQHSILVAQIEREQQSLARAMRDEAAWVACDSAPIATAIYSEIYFGDRSHYAAAALHHRSYDFTLLADTDLPWEPDGLQRESPAMRARFHALVRAWLQDHDVPFALVSGDGPRRARAALAALAAVQSSSR